MKSFLVSVFFTVLVESATACITRRCLANEIIEKEVNSAPQSQECMINVNLTSILYQTLSVDTKNLHFSSLLKINMKWKDPDLAWTDPQYKFSELMLPADTIWTPNLTVNNAIYNLVKPVSRDILVQKDGTVNYAIAMYITVICGINLFTYPFVSDSCPVAINGWNQRSCGLNLQYGSIMTVGRDQGEWKTLSVELHGNGNNYINVTLYLNPFNSMVSLVLPSSLIMIVDLVSFALPLEGGERNPFKIKLVFSFTMLLLILCQNLPPGGICSPLLYYHYCYCLIVLVTSVLISMMLTRLAKNGSFWPNRLQRLRGSKAQQDSMNPKKDFNLRFAMATSVKLTAKQASIQSILNFVENLDHEAREKKMRQSYANSWDRICFWTYLIMDIIYSISIIIISKTLYCKFDNLQF